jgi:hypothetical protein
MKRFATNHIMAVGLIVGLLTVGLLSSPASASANGPDGIRSCSVFLGTKIMCLGTINGNNIEIDITTNPAIDPAPLISQLDLMLAMAADISNIHTRVNTIATWIAQDLMRSNIHSCQVTVTEVAGAIRWTGFATCS